MLLGNLNSLDKFRSDWDDYAGGDGSARVRNGFREVVPKESMLLCECPAKTAKLLQFI